MFEKLSRFNILVTFMKNILIYGSCVSRDTLELVPKDSYNLVGYFARSSLATLSSNLDNSNVKKEYAIHLDKITSAFQRRMVEYDFDRSVLKSIEKNNFDVLLMDLIDERFHLAVLSNNSYVTRSNEFLRASIKPKSTINTHSDKFFELWTKGVRNFLNKLTENSGIEKILIQKTFWTNKLDNGTSIPDISDEKVKEENEKLEKMYLFLEKYLNKDQFIVVPDRLLLSKSEHKWGVSPFHYIDEYYNFINHRLFA